MTFIINNIEQIYRSAAGLAYITKRVDRNLTDDTVEMLAMENFCQLDLRLTEDKYRGSYERCAKIIKQYSSRVGAYRRMGTAAFAVFEAISQGALL